jgi:DNA repair photolyase
VRLQSALRDREIRTLTARASQVKDPAVARAAALKAWETIRQKKRLKASSGNASILKFLGDKMSLPIGVVAGKYVLHPPLIKRSKLTYVDKGGVGKELSDGWVINFAIGCTFGCRFCYVDGIHKKFSFRRAGNIVYNDWGFYFAVPENLDDVMRETEWEKWKGVEVMMSSTHDPYLPQLTDWSRKILENALPAGVRFCIQTRSPLVERDFELLKRYCSQIRLQVSIATSNDQLTRLIEPRVVKPSRRMETLRKAKEYGLTTGVIIAPVMPPVKARMDVNGDLEVIIKELAKIQPDHIYGESVHVRGINVAYLENAIGERLFLNGFDREAEHVFHSTLKRYGLSGRWWPEH